MDFEEALTIELNEVPGFQNKIYPLTASESETCPYAVYSLSKFEEIRNLNENHTKTRRATYEINIYEAYGNIYEETLQVVCINAYNKLIKEFSNVNFKQSRPKKQEDQNSNPEPLIKEAIQKIKTATGEQIVELEIALNKLIEKQTADIWDDTKFDLSDFKSRKIKMHFEENPKPMTVFEGNCFKKVIEKIVAIEPGKLKLVLKNGQEVYEDYKPMKGQVINAKKCGSNTSQVT